VQDRTFHVARARKVYLASADDALDATADGAFLGNDFAFEVCLFADRDRTRADVAINAAIDLDIARRGQRPDDNEVIGDDRRCRPANPLLRCRQRQISRSWSVSLATPCKHFAPHRKIWLDPERHC
jgi:hypothetical protein